MYQDKVSAIFEKIKILNDENTNLTQQKDLLLPRLMSGKLEIKQRIDYAIIRRKRNRLN